MSSVQNMPGMPVHMPEKGKPLPFEGTRAFGRGVVRHQATQTASQETQTGNLPARAFAILLLAVHLKRHYH
jgi:hypothetical protein